MTQSTALTIVEAQPTQLVLAPELVSQAKDYARQAKAENTRRAYRADWADFSTWCDQRGIDRLPATPATLALYVTDLADRVKVSAITRRLVTISQAHQAAGFESPTKSLQVREVVKGIRRAKGTAQEGKAPVLTGDVVAMVRSLPDSRQGLRDRALLLVGFAGAFRRSELVGLDADDVEFTREGLVVRLRHSKTDQAGEGTKKAIAYGTSLETCPVRTLQQWIEVCGISSGPLFRAVCRNGQIGVERLSDKAVARLVERVAKAAGLEPERYSGHSLRAGLATQAAINGAGERAIMKQTGHRSERMVRKYIRDGELFRDNVSAKLGL